jgi:hypothetical protein
MLSTVPALVVSRHVAGPDDSFLRVDPASCRVYLWPGHGCCAGWCRPWLDGPLVCIALDAPPSPLSLTFDRWPDF